MSALKGGMVENFSYFPLYFFGKTLDRAYMDML